MSSFFNQYFQDRSFVQWPISNLFLKDVRALVSSHFCDSIYRYIEMDDDTYRQTVADCQSEINKLGFQFQFCRQHQSKIEQVLGGAFHVQSNCYLRATRPISDHVQEAIGFHREVFYGSEIVKYAFNIWIPVLNVVESNSMFFIPMSHLIPDEEIKTKVVPTEESSVARFSSGHQIGLLYSPKTITDGVDLHSKERMVLNDNHFALFPADLIHGAAENKSTNIRFSLDFRIIATRYLEQFNDKSHHFSSNQKYFLPI